MTPKTAPNSAEAKKAARLKHILEAAVKAFSRWGYHNCTMNRVAQEAGVADGTLYLYVKGKEDLLVKAFTQVLFSMMEQLDIKLAKISSPIEKLEKLMELHLEVMQEDPDLAGFLQFQLRQPDPVIRAAIRTPLTEYANRIENILEDGKATGLFRKNLGTRSMRRVIFGALDETVSAWWFRREGTNLTAKAKPLLETILYGITVEERSS
jgi:TetR/AcrR family fatty acid metabolism transcriptional regulator